MCRRKKKLASAAIYTKLVWENLTIAKEKYNYIELVQNNLLIIYYERREGTYEKSQLRLNNTGILNLIS